MDTISGIQIDVKISPWIVDGKVMVVRFRPDWYKLFAPKELSQEECMQSINEFLIAEEQHNTTNSPKRP